MDQSRDRITSFGNISNNSLTGTANGTGTWNSQPSHITQVHEGTRYTPHELVFGKTVRIPSSDPPLENDANETYSEYLEQLFCKLREVQTIARENLNNAKTRSKKYYDRKSHAYNFKENDYVYLLKEPTKGKLGDQYIGPYRIIELLNNHNVKLAISNSKTRIVYSDKLKISPHRTPISADPHSPTSLEEDYNNETRMEDRPLTQGLR